MFCFLLINVMIMEIFESKRKAGLKDKTVMCGIFPNYHVYSSSFFSVQVLCVCARDATNMPGADK